MEKRVQTSEQAVAELKLEHDALKEEVKKLHDEISKLRKGSHTSRKTTELSGKKSLKHPRMMFHHIHPSLLEAKPQVADRLKYTEA